MWDKFYEDLTDEVKARYVELNSKECKEPDKQKKKNALMNASVPRGKGAKAGGGVITHLTPELKKIVTTADQRFDESWEEGASIPMTKKNLGIDTYNEMLQCGDLVEKKNDDGKMLAYIYKEYNQSNIESKHACSTSAYIAFNDARS